MIVVNTEKLNGIWTGGENNRYLCVFLSPLMQNGVVHDFSMGLVVVPPNTKGDMHSHTTQEVWYVIEGTGQFYIDGEIADVKPGDIVYSPERVTHQIINNTVDKVFKCLWIVIPDDQSEKRIVDGVAK